MVKHIVFWTSKPSADGRAAEGNALEMKRQLEAFTGRILGLIPLG